MSKKDVMLRIKTRQYQETLEPKGAAYRRELTLDDEIELMTEATVYTKSGNTYITYEEPEESGMNDRRTLIKLTERALEIRRYGEAGDGDMLHLEEGMRCLTRYHAPMGILEMELYTNELKRELDPDGCGEIYADYNIRMDDIMNRRNRLEIRIQPS